MAVARFGEMELDGVAHVRLYFRLDGSDDEGTRTGIRPAPPMVPTSADDVSAHF
jgi:hypothetical protein